MAVALYRKYRSQSLDDIVGQAHVTDVLGRALANGQIAHAYLLTGPRGVGKTSIARILAHEINQLPYSSDGEHLDIIEIDAASNNGVDDVRELRDKALIAPAVARKKIYIIDEVHMLSRSAFNALLKILEEPPEHIVFILATTDFDKLPATIVSRTQRYHFHAISPRDIAARLAQIAAQEKIAIDSSALDIIAERGDGSLRDSISLLDQVRHLATGNSTVSSRDVERALGLATGDELTAIISALASRQAASIIAATTAVLERGVSASTLATQLAARITTQLADTPELVHVLEGLLDTGKSAHPETKLYVTLLGSVVAKPKTVAQRAAVPNAPAIVSRPALATPLPATTPPATVVPSPTTTPIDPATFDWQAVLAHAQSQSLALHSILVKSTPDIVDGKLRLYVGRKFNKTKLDSSKYRPLLGQSLAHIGLGSDVEVETIGTSAPPKDSQAARIADMMGGGEEVDIDGEK